MQKFAFRFCVALSLLSLSACAADSPSDNEDTDVSVGRDVGIDALPDIGSDTGVDASDTGGADDVTPDVPDVGGTCGDGVVDPGETCDDGDRNSDTQPNACRTDCSTATCGDGVVDTGEACDDANLIDDDGCSRACARPAALLCESCSDNSDCGADGACNVLNDGNFCGISCESSSECADGFICTSIVDVDDNRARQCVPASGACTDCFDPDRDGFGTGPSCAGANDCNQSDAEINPGASEICDGLDNDCDGEIDEGLPTEVYYLDVDGDGFGDATNSRSLCAVQPGYADNGDDCDDARRLVNPDAIELCDEIDNDCDSEEDEETAEASFWPDADGDGYGDAEAGSTRSCEPVSGAATNNADCNDGNGLVSPGAPEVCGDGIDNNCDGDLDCDDATCSDAPECGVTTCVDDGLEDNDTTTTATAVGSGMFDDLVSCDADFDYYRVDLAVGDTLTVDLTFTGADIDAYLLDDTERVLAFGNSSTDDENITFVASAAGVHYIAVALYDGPDAGASYDMDIEIVAAAPTCRDDGFEDNDGALTAAAISTGVTDTLTACPGDADFYRIELTAGDQVDITAAFAQADGDLALRLQDADGAVLAEANTTTDNETLSHTVVTAGTYLVIVTRADDGAVDGTPYTLDVDVTATGTPCAPDAFEENDTFTTASAVGEGLYEVTVCREDNDNYGIAVAAGETLTIDLVFEHDEGDVELILFDADANSVASSIGSSDEERVVYTADSAGTYVASVYVLGAEVGVPVDYLMEIDITPAEVVCEDDFLEDNDTRETARFVAPGAIDDLRVCPGDDDYYYVDLSAGATLDATVSFADDAGDIDLRVLDPNGNVVASSTSVSDNESVSHEARTSGRYTVRVSLPVDFDDSPGNGYDLSLAVEEPVDECPTDRLERNDSQDGAEPLPPELYTGLVICDGNDDWYKTEVPAGSRMTVSLTFSDADADVELVVIRPDGTRATSLTSSDNEQVVIEDAAGGTYYTYVYVYGEGQATYDIQIELDAPTSGCADDALEDNDTTATATSAGTNDFTALVSCPADSDFFAFELGEGDLLTVLADFVDADGDIDMVLRNAADVPVRFGLSSDDGELFDYIATASGRYTLEVYLALDDATAGNDYTLSTEVTSVSSSCPTEDEYFGNQSFAASEPIGTGTQSGLNLCSESISDYFGFYGLAGERLTIALDFDAAEGDVDLYVYDSDEADVAASNGDTGREEVIIDVVTSGSFYIEAFLFEDLGEPGIDYTLSVTAE